ncbi:MAG: TIGR01212 family radical SAM protein [Bacteroidales bacterium]|jgi:radical SAM protein (TIGR01212 family)|nr:TIGR01212 family radical SAM protein [Bacteroidales bacterium]
MAYPWNHQRRYNAYADYLKKIFGERVQKLSIDAGFTCPNRDGLVSVGGCTYCDNKAFNPSYCCSDKSINLQIEEGIAFHQNRYRRVNKYLAYFQAYSNTYASLENLKNIYRQALANDKIIGLVIGTRPDCIDEEKLAFFAKLAETYYVILEYGIESCNNQSLKDINRGHDFEKSIWALKLTHQMGIHTGAHLIFGLPGETKQEWMQWAGIISELPIHAIKFHQLQLIKATPMAIDYQLNPNNFHLFEFDEYVDFIIDFLERLNPTIIIERLAGEVPPPYLVVNPWGHIRNDQILQIIHQKMELRNTWQGKYYN